MVVKPGIAQQRGFQILGVVEAMGGQDLGDTTLEALDHAIGLRAAWLGQTMLDAQGLAELVELMVTAGLTVSGSEQAIREFLAVVGQQVADLDRAGPVQGGQKGLGGRGRLVRLDLDEHPAGGAIHGDEEVTAPGFIRQLRQVFDVTMQVTRFVGLERRVGGFCLGLARHSGQAMALEQPLQTGARHLLVNELPRDHQQMNWLNYPGHTISNNHESEERENVIR